MAAPIPWPPRTSRSGNRKRIIPKSLMEVNRLLKSNDVRFRTTVHAVVIIAYAATTPFLLSLQHTLVAQPGDRFLNRLDRCIARIVSEQSLGFFDTAMRGVTQMVFGCRRILC